MRLVLLLLLCGGCNNVGGVCLVMALLWVVVLVLVVMVRVVWVGEKWFYCCFSCIQCGVVFQSTMSQGNFGFHLLS